MVAQSIFLLTERDAKALLITSEYILITIYNKLSSNIGTVILIFMPSYLQITAEIERLQKQAESARKREIAATIANIKKAIRLFGLTAKDLGLEPVRPGSNRSIQSSELAGREPGLLAKRARSKTRTKKLRKNQTGDVDRRSLVAPKYQNSSTGETWTGRGKQPKWLSAALESGKKLEDFRI
jgi:DNA-binding protein H-NS